MRKTGYRRNSLEQFSAATMKTQCFYVSTELFNFEIDYSVLGKIERRNFQKFLPFNCQFTLVLLKYLSEVSLKYFLPPLFFFLLFNEPCECFCRKPPPTPTHTHTHTKEWAKVGLQLCILKKTCRL